MARLKKEIKQTEKSVKKNKSYYLEERTIDALENIYQENQDDYKSVSALLQAILDNTIEY